MKIGSLFTGYGGLDMAVSGVTGAETVWVSDIDKGACKILTHRYPNVPNIGDITTVDWTQVEPVDVITGGSPCQDLSHAGKRAGMTDGTRSNLWVAMREAIAQIRPTYVIWENVRGAFSAAADSGLEWCAGCMGDPGDRGPVLRALGRVLGDLSDLGYDCQWRGLRAADVGAPHGRFRVFVVARLADAESNAGRVEHGDGRGAADTESVGRREGRPESARLVGRPDAAVSGHTPLTVLPTPATSDTNAPGAHGDGGLDPRTAVSLLPTPAVNDMGAGKTVDAWDAWTEDMRAKHGNGNGHGASLSIEAQRLLPTTTTRDYKDHEIRREPHRPDDTDTLSRALTGVELIPTPSAADALGGHEKRGGRRGDELLLNGHAKAGNLNRWGTYAAAIARWEPIIGRPAPDPTEPTGRNNAHRLSARFTEWMMGLPDGWITDVPGITRNEALKACGNGVVPQQAVAALRHLLGPL